MPYEIHDDKIVMRAGQYELKKPWVGLTDEDIWDTPNYEETSKMYRFARSIEAKLKEKNT